MTKVSNRWALFTKKAPPVGIPIELRTFPSHSAQEVILVSFDLSWSGILPYRALRRNLAGRQKYSEYAATGYLDQTQWRFKGAAPSSAVIARGERLIKDRARKAAALAKAQALLVQRRSARKRAALNRKLAWPIYRLRRVSCLRPGGANYYHHADVQAPTHHSAIRAAREGRVTNWRHIDTFDSCDEPYLEFEFLYRLNPEGARHIAFPAQKSSANWGEQRIKALPARRYLANGRVYGPIYPKASKSAATTTVRT